MRRGKYQDGVPYQAGQKIQPTGDGSVTHILETFGAGDQGKTINFKRVTDAELRKMEAGAAEGENVAEVAGDGEGGYNSFDTNIEDDNVYLEVSQFTKKLLATKPLNSPNPKKWYENGGEISISNGVWCYRDSMNHVVSYPNGYPDFAKARLVIDEVKLPEFRNYSTDFRSADKSCGKELLDNETWHHHEDLTTM